MRDRLNLVCRVAAVALLAGAGAGCSSGFTRFDRSLYSADAAPQPVAQNAAAQPYPGDIDYGSTASVNTLNRGPTPAETLGGSGYADHAGYDPNAAYGQQSVYSAPVQQQAYQQPAYQQPAYQQPVLQPAIQRGNLASPIENQPAYNRPLLAPQSNSARTTAVDPVKTATVKAQETVSAVKTQTTASAVATQKTVATTGQDVVAETQKLVETPVKQTGNERGWTATGGTAIELRDGETLYNLSKRYGVPVSAILSANNIKDASSVKAGQRIVIPTYVYSRNAPISAPDNDPSTMKASSARGELAQQQVAALDTKENKGQTEERRYKPKERVQDAPENETPDYSVTTGSVAKSGTINVASGDTLEKLAKKHSVSVSALKSANNLKSDSLRIGQVLQLPVAQKMAQAQPVDGVDPVITGSNPAQSAGGTKTTATSQTSGAQKQALADTDAPARTGIEEFRWPVRGRVISNFGEKTANGRNDGIDISVPEGTVVKAAENGVVVYAGSELEGLGNLVLVKHAGGWVSAYAHNKSIDVKQGAEVKRGQAIARSGRTGSAEMPMLHFELRKESSPVDPLKHLGG